MKAIIFATLTLTVCFSTKAQQSIECQVARQQILGAVNAQAQARAQSQANAQYQAQREASQLDPGAHARAMLYSGGAQLGSAIGGALGAEDPLQAQERRIQEAIQQYKSICER